MQEQLSSANALVSFYAAAALVQIDAQRAMPGIMNQLAERESWPAEAMARLLVDAGADVAREPIRALMLSLSPNKVPPLLPWLAHVDAVLGSEVAIELLRRHPDNPQIVAAALIVVLDPGVLPELARFADSADADVRKSLAVAYGHLGGLGDTETVTRLMCDKVWWVRYRAGQALLQAERHDRGPARGGPRAPDRRRTRATCSTTCAPRRRSHERLPPSPDRRAVGIPRLLHPAERRSTWASRSSRSVRLRRYMCGRSAAERVYSHLQMPISLVVPAYNEAATITTSIKALLQLRYQHFEVIIVNDGSKDDTLATMIRDFELTPFPEAYRVQIKTKPVRGDLPLASSTRTCA